MALAASLAFIPVAEKSARLDLATGAVAIRSREWFTSEVAPGPRQVIAGWVRAHPVRVGLGSLECFHSTSYAFGWKSREEAIQPGYRIVNECVLTIADKTLSDEEKTRRIGELLSSPIDH